MDNSSILVGPYSSILNEDETLEDSTDFVVAGKRIRVYWILHDRLSITFSLRNEFPSLDSVVTTEEFCKCTGNDFEFEKEDMMDLAASEASSSIGAMASEVRDLSMTERSSSITQNDNNSKSSKSKKFKIPSQRVYSRAPPKFGNKGNQTENLNPKQLVCDGCGGSWFKVLSAELIEGGSMNNLHCNRRGCGNLAVANVPWEIDELFGEPDLKDINELMKARQTTTHYSCIPLSEYENSILPYTASVEMDPSVFIPGQEAPLRLV